MDLIYRLDILKDANQISKKTYKIVIDVIDYLNLKLNTKLTEENGAMLITHLASALTRIENNDTLEKVENFIFDEIKKDKNYDKSIEITNEIENITGKLPLEEKEFIEMHLCTLLNK